MKGLFESYEREHYDLLRSGMLKYLCAHISFHSSWLYTLSIRTSCQILTSSRSSFQTQIGNMDGIFLAYHNTSQIFGFQYMSTADMEVGLFGKKNAGVGENVFRTCLALLEKTLEVIGKHFPEQVRYCHIHSIGFKRSTTKPNYWSALLRTTLS